MQNKPNYGFDAPSVVRWLSIFGLVSLVLAYFAFTLLREENPLIAKLLCGYFCFTALSLFFSAAWTLYSSLVLKPKILERLASELILGGDEKVLDVGCGRGLFSITVAKHLSSGKVYGIDLWQEKDQYGNSSESTLRNARLEGVDNRLEVQTADMRELSFPDGFFDVVISSLAIHNVHEEEERNRALKEILRVLKPGGQFTILDIKFAPKYAAFLHAEGAKDVKISPLLYRYCPPIVIVKGKKG